MTGQGLDDFQNAVLQNKYHSFYFITSNLHSGFYKDLGLESNLQAFHFIFNTSVRPKATISENDIRVDLIFDL